MRVTVSLSGWAVGAVGRVGPSATGDAFADGNPRDDGQGDGDRGGAGDGRAAGRKAGHGYYGLRRWEPRAVGRLFSSGFSGLDVFDSNACWARVDALGASPMNIRRLQHIVVLADEGNFRRAAERVHLSQPAFSRSIQAAEAELGLKLFDRGTLEARATPAGAFVVERARSLLQQTSNLERDVSLYRERAIGDMTFGCGPFPAAALVPQLLAELRHRYPAVGVCVQVSNAFHLLANVRHEEHDFFVANIVDVPRDGMFHVERIGQLPAGLFVRHGHPLLARQSLRMADLLPYGIATGRLPRDTLLRLGRLMGLPPEQKLWVAVECDDIQLLRRIALDSDTAIVATRDQLADDLEHQLVHELLPHDMPPHVANLGIVTLAGRTPSPVAAFAMQFLAQVAKTRAAAP